MNIESEKNASEEHIRNLEATLQESLKKASVTLCDLGMAKELQLDYITAHELYSKALEYDPTNENAKKKVEESARKLNMQ